MFLTVLLGILYVAALLAAALGCCGMVNLFLLDSRFGVLGHVLAWLASACVLAALVSIAVVNQWGPFNPDACTRSRPCVRVEVQQ